MKFEFEERDQAPTMTLYDGENRIGGLDYHRREDGDFVIDYIQVNPERRGEGLARKILDHFVDHVRKEEKKITARCGVARRMMEGDARYDDIR